MEVIAPDIKKAARAIKDGKILVCPTDTVYGLICDAGNRKAIARIYLIKRRPRSKPLPVFIKNIAMAKELAEVSKIQEKFLRKIWPGRTTIILRSKKVGTIGLRMPCFDFLLKLMKYTGPLIETSANLSGLPPSLAVEDILVQFINHKHQPDMIIDGGKLKTSKPSRVIDLTKKKPIILRK